MLSHALKFMSNDCFGHAFLVTVKITGISPHCVRRTRVKLRRSRIPWKLFPSFTSVKSGSRRTLRAGWDWTVYLRHPQFNYEPFNSNSINIRSWSWNYRGLYLALGEVYLPLWTALSSNPTHHSTDRAIRSLTSEIRRDLVLYPR